MSTRDFVALAAARLAAAINTTSDPSRSAAQPPQSPHASSAKAKPSGAGPRDTTKGGKNAGHKKKKSSGK
jgi:hypothetical protein